MTAQTPEHAIDDRKLAGNLLPLPRIHGHTFDETPADFANVSRPAQRYLHILIWSHHTRWNNTHHTRSEPLWISKSNRQTHDVLRLYFFSAVATNLAPPGPSYRKLLALHSALGWISRYLLSAGRVFPVLLMNR